jgi:hypothetical protein
MPLGMLWEVVNEGDKLCGVEWQNAEEMMDSAKSGSEKLGDSAAEASRKWTKTLQDNLQKGLKRIVIIFKQPISAPLLTSSKYLCSCPKLHRIRLLQKFRSNLSA